MVDHLIRRGLAVLLLGGGCLVDNPAWLGSGGGAGTSGASDSSETAAAGTMGSSTNDGTASSGSTAATNGTLETSSDTSGGPEPPAALCDPLPPAAGDFEQLDPGMSATDRADVLAGLESGDVLVFAAGEYAVGAEPLVIATPGVTVRSASGDPDDVVIAAVGGAETLIEIRASDVRLAGVTLAGSTFAAVSLGSAAGPISNVSLDHVVVRDHQRFGIRGWPQGDVDQNFVDQVEIACASFSLSGAYRAELERMAVCGQQTAVSAIAADGWVVRDNRFSGYFCPTQGLAEAPTVVLTDGSRGTIFERNLVESVFRGIVLGGQDPSPTDVDGNALPPPTPTRVYEDIPCDGDVYWGHIGGIVRNNRFWNGGDDIVGSVQAPDGIDSMISFWRTCGGTAAHNTIIGLVPPEFSFAGIEYRYEGTEVDLFNNVSTYEQKPRDGAGTFRDTGNLFNQPANVVVGPLDGDLHLAEDSAARNIGVALAEVPTDFEGDERDATPDAGADEYVSR